MPQDYVVRYFDRATAQLCCFVDLLSRKRDRLRVGKIERRWKTNRQIVIDFV